MCQAILLGSGAENRVNTARAADTTGEKGGDAMGILEPERTDAGPHPRREPRFDGPLTLEARGRCLRAVRTIWSGGCTSTETGRAR